MCIRDSLSTGRYCWLDISIKTHHKGPFAMEDLPNTLNVIQTEFLLEASDNYLKSAIEKINLVCGDFENANSKKISMACRPTNVTAKAAITWTTRVVLYFIVTCDFTESIPNLHLVLQYFLINNVFVASYERIFTKINQNYFKLMISEKTGPFCV